MFDFFNMITEIAIEKIKSVLFFSSPSKVSISSYWCSSDQHVLHESKYLLVCWLLKNLVNKVIFS
jgi:hypothetical protein